MDIDRPPADKEGRNRTVEGCKSADLRIHGRLAAILAAQEASRDVSRDLRDQRSSSESAPLASSSRWKKKQNSVTAARRSCRAWEGMDVVTSVVGCGGTQPTIPAISRTRNIKVGGIVFLQGQLLSPP
jgi:hypothetical protein